MARARLDQFLVARGHFSSRARARDAIVRGCVRVDGVLAAKPGQGVGQTATLDIDDPAQDYVARSALKLLAALDAFQINVQNLHMLDVGQSTGGFTQVLLERGARHVTGVDVGVDQIAQRLRTDSRVSIYEGVNARDGDALPDGPFDGAVVDISFISLRLVLPAIVTKLSPSANLVALFKPQFEVGKQGIGKGGLVREESAADKAKADLMATLAPLGWQQDATIRSPLPGSDGNVEHLLHLVRA